MSVETRGRQAAESLRRATTVDVEHGLLRVRRTRRRRDVARVAIAAAVLTAAVGGVLAVRDHEAARGPIKPSPMRNGKIVPPKQGEQRWLEFDQRTGSALYFHEPEVYLNAADYYAVVRNGRELAHIDCPFSGGCGGLQAFGPGPREISMVDRETSELGVLRYDGTARGTIDLRDALWGQAPSSVAWSPDGVRLAVSTDCEHATAGCEARVWLLDRDGGNTTAVYSTTAPTAQVEGTKLEPLVRELTWSPAGDTLAFIVHTDDCGAASDAGVRPTLVALKLRAGRATTAETLHTYDDINCHGDLLPWHYPAHFNFAWAPDGTRLAVTTGSGFSEISATDGQVLARHAMSPAPGEDFVTGPLAWFRAP